MNQQSEFNAELDGILENVKGGSINTFMEVYDLIDKQEQPGLALRIFLEKADSLEEVDEEDDPTELDLMQFEYRCGTLVEGILDNLICERPGEDDFYCALWTAIQESQYFEQKKEKAYALYEVWTDGRIPYYKIEEGIRMNDEEFREIGIRNIDKISKIIFILNSKFAQKTERSSQIIRVLDSLESEKDKAVILAQIMAMVDKRAYLRGIHKME